MKNQKTNRHDSVEKWNKRASTYPRYSDEGSEFENNLIKMILEKGVSFEGKSVLDIGCGTGRYTLRIAKMAKNVLGIDISEDMLEIMMNDAEEEGIDNLESMRSDWKGFKSDRIWPITFCSITPAVKDEEDFAKMMEYTSEHAVFLGWHDRVEPDVVKDAYSLFDISPMKLDFADHFIKWLDENGFSYSHTVLEDIWHGDKGVDEMVEKIVYEIKEYDVEPDEKLIKDTIQKYADENNVVSYKTKVNQGLIIVEKK
jgi:SAM-dependent methyltransferase